MGAASLPRGRRSCGPSANALGIPSIVFTTLSATSAPPLRSVIGEARGRFDGSDAPGLRTALVTGLTLVAEQSRRLVRERGWRTDEQRPHGEEHRKRLPHTASFPADTPRAVPLCESLWCPPTLESSGELVDSNETPFDPSILCARAQGGKGSFFAIDRALSAPAEAREAVPSSPRRGLGPAMDVELLEDVVDVILDGRELDRELLGDLLVRAALLDQPQDVELPRRQPSLDRVEPALARERAHAAEQCRRDPGRAHQLAARDALDRGHEILHRSFARDVARGPRLGEGDHVRLVLDPGRGADDVDALIALEPPRQRVAV